MNRAMNSTDSIWEMYRWPVGIICFFVILAVANSWLLVTALQQQPPKVDANPYQSSLRYNEVQQRLSYAKKISLTTEVTSNESEITTQSEKLYFKLSSPEFAPSDLVAESLVLRRADTDLHDQKTTLARSAESGDFIASVQLPKTGMWTMVLEVRTPEGIGRLENDFFVR